MLWLWPSRKRAEIKNVFFHILDPETWIFHILDPETWVFHIWLRPGIWLKSRSVSDPAVVYRSIGRAEA